jgi:hypothetical protein
VNRMRPKRPRLRLDPVPYDQLRNRFCGAMAGDVRFVVPDRTFWPTTGSCAVSRARMTT